MRFWVRSLLFISAYTPLLLIFVVRYFDYHALDFWILVFMLFLVNLIWVPIFMIVRGWASKPLTVAKSKNRTNDALDYIIA
jgi:hypothetical protein